MPKFEKGNKLSKGRAKGSGYVDRCKKWADKKGWGILERVAEGKRPLGKKDEAKAIKEEGGLVETGNPKVKLSPIQNDLPSSKLSILAARTLIEYGFGKPRVAVDLDPDNKGENTLFGFIAAATAAERSR